MHDRGEAGTSTEKPGNDYDSYFDAEQHCGGDHFSHGAPCDWMPGGGRGRRRAMMMAMMSDPSGVYGMDHGHGFGFGGRGGGRGRHGGWFGFGGRGQRHGHGGRGRGRNGRGSGRFFVDDDDEYVTSMAEQMNECHLKEGRKRDGSGSGESSSSSSSSESDDEQNAPDVDVQGRQPHDGDVHETEGQATDQAQQETTKSNATEMQKEKASSQHTCNHGKHGCRNGRGYHKHHHGKHKHHCHTAPHHSMIPPQMPPHLRGFNRPPFPPMHHSHHRFSDCHGNRHMAKKFFKKSMKQWAKAQKKAWKQQQGSHCCHHHRRQRSDEDEQTTSGCDNDDDFELPEGQCQLPPPWLFFQYDHHGCGHGRRGFGRHEKKGKKHDKRLRKCNGERPRPAEDTAATKTQVDDVNNVEKVHEVHDECEDDQAPMEEAAE
ncbi:hornerin [Strongylocentrotus purpuratus]|uniref:Uncharacterized protein n=1 Tax=Strongylocentrotus purpuratus TaxID=7668 RepID=A0A7M7NP15_STRPU|nr:hornerin [Strongylocentrotus purpuratus]